MKEKLNQLFIKNKIEEAIDLYLSFCIENNKDSSFSDTLNSLKSDFKELNEQFFENLIDDKSFQIGKAKIKKRLQHIINQIEDTFCTVEILEGNILTGLSEIGKNKLDFFGRANESINLVKEINLIPKNDFFEIIQINGIGGIGKTSLVLNYLSKHQKKYHNIAWIKVHKNSSLNDILVQDKVLHEIIDYKIDYPNEAYIDTEIASINKTTIEQLNQKIDYEKEKKVFFKKYNAEKILLKLKTKFSKPNLLIIDFDKNIDGIESIEMINLLNEIRDKWCIVILSRNSIQNIKKKIELKGLFPESAWKLFSKTLGNVKLEKVHEQFFELIKYHPLAIKIAALQIKNGNLDLSKLIENYHTQGLAQLNIEEALEYFLSLSKLNGYENLILSLFALFPAKSYTKEDFKELGFDKLKLTKKQIKDRFLTTATNIKQNFYETLDKLVQQAWISLEGNAFQMHPLIQETVRSYETGFVNDCQIINKLCNKIYEQIDDAFKNETNEKIDEVFAYETNEKIEEVFTYDLLSIDTKFLQYLKYADYLITHLNRKTIKPDLNGFILSVKTSYDNLQNKKDAIRFLEYYIEVLRNQGYSDKGMELVDFYIEIIELAEEDDEYYLKYSENILVALKNNTRNVREIASIYKRRGSLNLKFGRIEEAWSDVKQAYNYYKNILPQTEDEALSLKQQQAATINNLGCILSEMDEYKEAKKYIEQAFNEYKKLYDYESYSMAWLYTNMGVIEYKLKHYKNADLYFREVLEISKIIFPENNFQNAIFYSNFALTCSKLKQFDDAVLYIEKAIRIIKEIPSYRKSDLLVLLRLKLEILYEIKDVENITQLVLEINELETNKERFIYFFQTVMYL